MKQRVLSFLSTVADASAAEIGDALGASRLGVGMIVLRLTRVGLLARTFDPRRGCHYYSLTQRGLARLRFLQRRPPRP